MGFWWVPHFVMQWMGSCALRVITWVGSCVRGSLHGWGHVWGHPSDNGATHSGKCSICSKLFVRQGFCGWRGGVQGRSPQLLENTCDLKSRAFPEWVFPTIWRPPFRITLPPMSWWMITSGDRGSGHYDRENGHQKFGFLLCYTTQRCLPIVIPKTSFVSTEVEAPKFSNILDSESSELQIANFGTQDSNVRLRSQKGFLGSRVPWASDPNTTHAPNTLECFVYLAQCGVQKACQNFKSWRQDFSTRSDSNFHAGSSVHTKDDILGHPTYSERSTLYVLAVLGFLKFSELWIHCFRIRTKCPFFLGRGGWKHIFDLLVTV